jgi:hypothetical protein
VERERFQASQRELQAAKDREAARATKFEQELAQLRAAAEGGSTQQATTLDPATLAREVFAESQKLAALAAKADALRESHKYADPSIFENATGFDSVEALEAAAKASHDRIASAVEVDSAAKVQAALEEASAKYGFQMKTPAAAPETPSGEPTVDQWAAMSMDEQDAMEAEHPGISDRILRSAYERG